MKITQQEPTPTPFKPIVITLEIEREVERLSYLVNNFVTLQLDIKQFCSYIAERIDFPRN